MIATNINLTPNPRILQMLGQIDFDNWQCIAELVDNSIDALLKDYRETSEYHGEIRVEIPTFSQFQEGKPITVWDNGPGMTVEQLENALKAGYTGNDPISNLGLFGMGFNIATARLGDKTTVYTSRKGDSSEVGIEIDFREMIESNSFDRPVISRPKDNSYTSGTTIRVSMLKDRVSHLGQQGLHHLRTRLSDVYSKLLRDYDIDIHVNGEKLEGAKKCVWAPERYVVRGGDKIHARIDIDRDLGPKYFCTRCWVWLNTDVIEGETTKCPICDSATHVRVRQRVVKGWLGVQRYYDKQNYGIDTYRNGRLIVAKDKSFFEWVNPETGERELEYPIDATHWGGRLVGEIEANFLKVNYTKDSFEKGDVNWDLLVKVIRGEGPIRPNIARELGYAPNESPLARLFRGFRKGNRPGFGDLLPGRYNDRANRWEGSNTEPKAWAELFEKGEPEYQSDQKWWELVVAVEEDRRSTVGESNEIDPTDPDFASEDGGEPGDGAGASTAREDGHSYGTNTAGLTKDNDLSGTYEVEETGEEPIVVEVYRDDSIPDDRPLILNKLSHSNFRALYKPEAPVLEFFGHSVKDVLMMELANSLFLRIADKDEWPVSRIYYELKRKYCAEELLDLDTIRQRVRNLLRSIRTKLATRAIPLNDGFSLEGDDYTNLHRSVLNKLGEGTGMVETLMDTTAFLAYMPIGYIPRFFARKPEVFFDGIIWRQPFDEMGDEAVRREMVDQFGAYLGDILWLATQDEDEVLADPERFRRNASSLRLLENYTV